MKELIVKVDDEKIDIEGNAPIVDRPQELIRCENCKKHDTYDCNITYLTTQKTPNDWFCADGKRKEGR